LDIFGKAKTTLYLQTYEFTEKRIRALFKQLLENDVDIKLIMEDKKYQQFKNTFKEIQNLFS
jgi:predicted transcriptional regulator